MPRSKPNKEHLIREYITNKGFEIQDEYIESWNTNTPIKVICKKNKSHIFTVNISQLKNGRKKLEDNCPHCKREDMYNNNRININEIQEWFNNNNLEINNKKTFYSKWKDKIETTCKLCGKQSEILSINHFINNCLTKQHKCEGCFEKKIEENKEENTIGLMKFKQKNKNDIVFLPKLDLDKVPLLLSKNIKKQSKWVLVEYTNTRNKCKYQCVDCGYIKECYPHTIFNGRGHGCKQCKLEKGKESVVNKISSLCEGTTVYPIQHFEHSEKNIKFKCSNCEHEFERKWIHINGYENLNCPSCFSSKKRKSQNDLGDFIKSLGFNVICDTRELINPFEIDIFIPEKNIAIEYCGSIWHSEKFKKDKNYHRKKYELCQNKNLRLITVFEEEWKDKNEICKSRIKNILGLTENRIYGRKCQVKFIDTKVALDFCQKNHIQGKGQAHYACGAFFNEQLVSVMTFSKPSISKGNKDNNSLELNRFCSLLNTNVIGIANKLFKFFSVNNNIELIYSYCDLRWGNGKVYENMNMRLENITKPNYYYVGNYTKWKLKHRFNFTKQRLLKLFGGDPLKTERELAEENGLYRIWDCGHKKFIIDYNNKEENI